MTDTIYSALVGDDDRYDVPPPDQADRIRTQAELKESFFDSLDQHGMPEPFAKLLEEYIDWFREIIADRARPAPRTVKAWELEYMARKS